MANMDLEINLANISAMRIPIADTRLRIISVVAIHGTFLKPSWEIVAHGKYIYVRFQSL
jgi:hypothetical protein